VRPDESPPNPVNQPPSHPGGSRNPWSWIPSLYLAEGLPYVVVMTVSVIMFKGMGLSNTDIALYTSWLYLPWVIKPLWSPVVDILKTRRLWIWTMQLIIGGGLAGVALTIPTSNFLRGTLAFLWLLAFSSATHDIAADGFYMLATTEQQQAFFVGIRSTFYRISMISGQGLLVILAGLIQTHTGLPPALLEVQTAPQAALIEPFQPPAAISSASSAKDLRILMEPRTISLPLGKSPPEEVTERLKSAHDWNSSHSFTPQPASASKSVEEKSWWTKNVSSPLGAWIRHNFGRAGDRDPSVKKAVAGNVAFAWVRLSGPPEKDVVIDLAQKSGDKSIFLAEGSRLIFRATNWNMPAVLVFQADPKLRSAVSATYHARSGNIPLSWMITFMVMAGLFLVFGVYHRFALPRPDRDRPGDTRTVLAFLREFFLTFRAFFCRDRIGILLLFLLFYRFAEAQLVKLVTPFLLDVRELGGLGLTTGQVGFAYGTIGIAALTCGGLLGGFLASRKGLRYWLWPMVLIMHLPDAMFVYLAYAQPENFLLVNICVAVETFGYGFGFTAYMLYMIYISRGKHETAHYAICTGFMALGMMLPGMLSGWLQENLGYQHFFVWVMLATIPGFIVAALVPIDPEFGKKT
jgi:PAT family beta-lactamase induction signal transducer AmpG